MRKPLVVVSVTASAVLLIGAVAATTAGADTTTDAPAVPGVALPDVPGMADGGQQLPVVPGLDLPGLVAQAPAPAQEPAADPADGPADGPAQPDADDPADGPAQPGDDEPATTPARPGGADKPGPAQAKPDDEEPIKQKPSGLKAAAQQDVSPNSAAGTVDSPVQRQVLGLVNENRRRGGCGNLTLDRRLIAAANRHASEMARRGFFAHESPNGDGSGDRMKEAGYDWSRYGENIARGQESVYEVVDGWMHSPAHRENIMDCKLEQMGIGLAFDGDEAYWVQDFATPQ